MRRYRRGIAAAVLAGVYGGLVLFLGVTSLVILLTVRDPILISAVALALITFPLGWLLWWGWDLPPLDSADPVWLVVLLTGAGLLQAWIFWRVFRGPALPGGAPD
jgi:hypothetical protein